MSANLKQRALQEKEGLGTQKAHGPVSKPSEAHP